MDAREQLRRWHEGQRAALARALAALEDGAGARPGDTFIREETIKTERFEGKVPITYFHVPPEHRRHRGETLLYVLPPAPEKKRHGGRKTIPVPPEVAAQDAPVRRETRRVERFYSLVDDRRLGTIESPATIDYCNPDGTVLTQAEADRFQDAIGVRPARRTAPPRWAPPVQRPFQLDDRSTRACRQLSRMTEAARWIAARKVRAVLS